MTKLSRQEIFDTGVSGVVAQNGLAVIKGIEHFAKHYVLYFSEVLPLIDEKIKIETNTIFDYVEPITAPQTGSSQ